MTLYEESRVEELKGQGAFVSFDVGFQNIMVFFLFKVYANEINYRGCQEFPQLWLYVQWNLATHSKVMQQSIRVIPTLINPPIFSKTVGIGPKNIWIHQIYKELFGKTPPKELPLGGGDWEWSFHLL